MECPVIEWITIWADLVCGNELGMDTISWIQLKCFVQIGHGFPL